MFPAQHSFWTEVIKLISVCGLWRRLKVDQVFVGLFISSHRRVNTLFSFRTLEGRHGQFCLVFFCVCTRQLQTDSQALAGLCRGAEQISRRLCKSKKSGEAAQRLLDKTFTVAVCRRSSPGLQP